VIFFTQPKNEERQKTKGKERKKEIAVEKIIC
jgi:hypothetical protein